MAKACDNKSVAVLVWKDGTLLMIERKKYNFGYAMPAGHQDGDGSETTAKKELSEEVGLTVVELQEKLKITLPNPCKREGGTHHDWTVVETTRWLGEVRPSADETKSYIWADKEKILAWAKRLEEFTRSNNLSLEVSDLHKIVKATNENLDWQENPGLEPPIYFLFKKLGII